MFWEKRIAPQNLDTDPRRFLQLNHLSTFAIIQVASDIFVDPHHDFGGVWHLASHHQQAFHFNRHALGRLDQASTAAAWAIFIDAAFETRPNALASHFDQAEWARPQDLGPSSVAAHGIAERLLHLAAMRIFPHVDEVIDDDSTQISQSQLPCNFLGSVHVEMVSVVFRVLVPSTKITAVDVDRDQGFGLIDDD